MDNFFKEKIYIIVIVKFVIFFQTIFNEVKHVFENSNILFFLFLRYMVIELRKVNMC